MSQISKASLLLQLQHKEFTIPVAPYFTGKEKNIRVYTHTHTHSRTSPLQTTVFVSAHFIICTYFSQKQTSSLCENLKPVKQSGFTSFAFSSLASLS